MATKDKKTDLRKTDWREAIVKISEAIEDCPLTDRAIALLIADTTAGVTLGQALKVLTAIPRLRARYLKGGK